MRFDDDDQLYFHATITGGTFGTGTGDELASPPDSHVGSYTRVWLPLNDLPRHDVRPRHLAEILTGADGWVSAEVVELSY